MKKLDSPKPYLILGVICLALSFTDISPVGILIMVIGSSFVFVRRRFWRPLVVCRSDLISYRSASFGDAYLKLSYRPGDDCAYLTTGGSKKIREEIPVQLGSFQNAPALILPLGSWSGGNSHTETFNVQRTHVVPPSTDVGFTSTGDTVYVHRPAEFIPVNETETRTTYTHWLDLSFACRDGTRISQKTFRFFARVESARLFEEVLASINKCLAQATAVKEASPGSVLATAAVAPTMDALLERVRDKWRQANAGSLRARISRAGTGRYVLYFGWLMQIRWSSDSLMMLAACVIIASIMALVTMVRGDLRGGFKQLVLAVGGSAIVAVAASFLHTRVLGW
ncbi:Uncharacterised protein [Bordetella ansorpii]|uniref:Uncharacterized protein n=1 Tax=Bordetella ansorpii TaxID=288768 RepID=A0A157PPM1_9BORD|nr:hypothetical protein [Bordetella ansorpii]SAI35250.1 Uncharacterised protein [Bordetella ansorpii]